MTKFKLQMTNNFQISNSKTATDAITEICDLKFEIYE